MPTYQDEHGRIVHSYVEGSVLDNQLQRDGWEVIADSQSYVDDDIYQAVPEINQIPFKVKKHSDKQILEEINQNTFDLLSTGEGASNIEPARAGSAKVNSSTVAPESDELKSAATATKATTSKSTK